MTQNGDLRTEILNKKDIESKCIFIKVWGVEVEVRGLSGRARADLLKAVLDEGGKMDFGNLYAELVIATVYNPQTGSPIFTSADRDSLKEKSAVALDEIIKVAGPLAGIGAEALEKSEKNL